VGKVVDIYVGKQLIKMYKKQRLKTMREKLKIINRIFPQVNRL